MNLEKIINRTKDVGKRALLGLGLFGLLAIGSCKVEVPSDVGVTLDSKNTGTIKGKVVWDPDKDGIYTGAGSINVSVDAPVQLNPKYKTITVIGGNFSFQEIPTGTYTIWANATTYNPACYWRTKTGVTVTKQEIVDMGEIKLEIYTGPGYKINN